MQISIPPHTGSGVDFAINLQETQVSVNGTLQCTVHSPQKARKVEVKFRAWEWVMYGAQVTSLVSFA